MADGTGSATTTDGLTGPDSGVDPNCMPGSTQPCICPGGMSGEQTCAADGASFGSCECPGTDSASSTTSGPDPTTGDADSTTAAPPPECEVDADCVDLETTECEVPICDDGDCEADPLSANTPCGDPTDDECTGPDICNGAGTCLTADEPDSAACTGCPSGICVCTTGTCGDCGAFASANNFITSRSIEGWTLSGDWSLYREAPQNQQTGPVLFSSQVFGTNGNRSMPLPGAEIEVSSAQTPPMVLPASLDFLSWNVDEGSGFDSKAINVSVDGGMTFSPIFGCEIVGGQPFCDFRDDSRAPDDWDVISIPVPPPLVGQVGILEFTYNTGDSCCGFEKGWYIDATNFATACACASDAVCTPLGGDCGTGMCGVGGECELDPMLVDTACGDVTDNECNAPDLCDGVGYCLANEVPNATLQCEDCAAGAGDCHQCLDGVCGDCQNLAPTNEFNFGGGSIEGWLIEDLDPNGSGADWQIFFSAPQTTTVGSMPVPLAFAPSFGTDGNRVAPYADALQEVENSRVTTSADTVPASITFDSWHVDEGGISFDTKLIEISVDGGMTWDTLEDCSGGLSMQPFCQPLLTDRLGDDWDPITIDTAAYVGMVGQLRFTYNTGDTCCGSERGWFIDNLNFAQRCSDPQFPQPPLPPPPP